MLLQKSMESCHLNGTWPRQDRVLVRVCTRPKASRDSVSQGVRGRHAPALQGVRGRHAPALQGVRGRHAPALQGVWGRHAPSLQGGLEGGTPPNGELALNEFWAHPPRRSKFIREPHLLVNVFPSCTLVSSRSRACSTAFNSTTYVEPPKDC